MKFLRTALTVLAILLSHHIYAQLEIGSSMPDLDLTVSNYPKTRIRLSDLRGKLVILDFWAHNCSNCIRSFPKIDSLQKAFEGKVQIILVNAESSGTTEKFFKERKKIHRPGVPFASGDTVLHKLFPHSGSPYHVWIDEDGIIRYMTDGYNATKENIVNVLNKKYFKARSFGRIKYISSLFDSARESTVEYFSYISHCMNHVFLGNVPCDDCDQLVFNCYSIVDLYKAAFSEGGKYAFSSSAWVVPELADSLKYIYPRDNRLKDEWRENFSYNYQLSIPKKWGRDKYKLMQEDLQRYFNLYAAVEEREMDCLVLATKKDHRRKTRDEALTAGYPDFIASLKAYTELYLLLPFLDRAETKDLASKFPVLDASYFTNLATINQYLSSYGLVLNKKRCRIPVLVLKEK